MEYKPTVPIKIGAKVKQLTNEMAEGDVPVGFFHENEGVSAVGLITPKQYKIATKREFIEEYKHDFDEEELIKQKYDEKLKKREEKEIIKFKSKSKANQTLSFIDDDQEEDTIKPVKQAKPDDEYVKPREKVSLFGSKLQKISDDKDESDYIQKRKVKGFGKDPGVNTSFLPDEDKEIEEEIKKQKLMNKFIKVHMETRKEMIKISYCYWDGRGNKRRIVIRKGDSIRDVIEKCLKRIQKENKDLSGVTPDTFMAIKADIILPNHILIMDILSQQKQEGGCKCKGKQECQQCLFKIEKHAINKEDINNKELFSEDDKEDFNDVTDIEIDSGPMLKIVERRIYEQNRYMFPYYNWKTFELTGFRR